MTLPAGIHDAIPSDLYHRDALTEQPTLSRSGIQTILTQTLAAFRANSPRLALEPVPQKTSDAMDLGVIVHDMMRGHLDSFVARDCTDFNKKDGTPYETWSGAAKEWKEQQQAAGMIVIGREKHAMALRIVAKLTERCVARFGAERWANRKNEQTVLWERRLNDGSVIWCRARPDIMLPDGHIVDIKTTAKAMSDEALGKEIALAGLDIQAAHYAGGVQTVMGLSEPPPFTLAYVGTEEPHSVRFQRMDSWLPDARMLIDIACHRYGRALKTGEWPDWPEEAEAKPPTWIKTQRFELFVTEGMMEDDE